MVPRQQRASEESSGTAAGPNATLSITSKRPLTLVTVISVMASSSVLDTPKNPAWPDCTVVVVEPSSPEVPRTSTV
jgi:hypothetical protein